MASIFTLPWADIGAGIKPADGALLNFYDTGTYNRRDTYTDAGAGTPHANPVVADANGVFPAIYLDGAYRVVLTDKNGVQYEELDGVNESVPSGDSKTVKTFDTLADAVASTDLSLGDTVEIIERQSGEGGGSLWSVVDSYLFTDNGFNIVACTGLPLLSLSLVIGDEVNAISYGVRPDGSDQILALSSISDYARTNEKNIYFPAGVYSSGILNMPFRNTSVPVVSLLDFKGITIRGDGQATVMRSDSVNGADIFQLNGVKNLCLRDFKIKASISGSLSGSNGVSVTNGFDNIIVKNIYCEDLPSLDKTSFVDGGAAFTVQTPTSTTTTECGTISFDNCYAKGCSEGFAHSFDVFEASTRDISINADVTSEDCYIGFKLSSGAATGVISTAYASGTRIKGKAINCQKDLVLSRAQGVDADVQVVTTKTIAERRLNPSGVAWRATDTVVLALSSTYARNASVRVYGDKGACDYKAQIGGASVGSAGFLGYTTYCDFYIDLGGTPVTADFDIVNSGGFVVRYCRFYISRRTTQTALPTVLYSDVYQNIVTSSTSTELLNKIPQALIGSSLDFAYTDGVSSFTTLERDVFGVFARQSGSSAASTLVLGAQNNSGVKQFAVRNDGRLCTEGTISATSATSQNSALPIYNVAGTLLGYIPIYTTVS